MELIITARSQAQNTTEYLPVEMHGLAAAVEISGGTGSSQSPFQAVVTIQNTESKAWTGVIHIELPFKKVNPRYFLPAFMYGRNRGEAPMKVPCEFPRLREAKSPHSGTLPRPSSDWWMTRSDRLSHPVALVYDTGKVTGLSASPYFIKLKGKKQQWLPKSEGEFYQYGGYSCSIAKGTVGYTLGFENAPLMFINAFRVRERAELSDYNCFSLEAGEAIELRLELFDYAAESELDINGAIQQVYYKYHQSPRKASDVKKTVYQLAKAVSGDAWLPQDLAYSGQVFEEKGGGFRYNKILSLSWTNGMSVAAPMLMSALRLGDEEMRQQALSCIDNIVENSLNPASGLPFDACEDGNWSNNGWWFDSLPAPGHSSYLCGQALFYILKAYEYEKRLKNNTHNEWLTYVEGVLKKLVLSVNSDGEYPFVLSQKNGVGLDYDSFSGAWCLAALAYFSWLTGDRTYLDSMKKSEQHYYREYVAHMECYGAPLDTFKAVDSEGILAYIKAIKYLHAITGEVLYLEHMKNAIHYEFSFKFCYNSPVQIPPLSKMGWSSCGGSVTSVSNPHIHPMSSNIIGELIYYVENCEDEYVKDRLEDTIGWSCQNHNTFDREFDFGKLGWMSERFCYSEGLVYETYSDGTLASTWFCLMPWAVASILDGLAGECWELVR